MKATLVSVTATLAAAGYTRSVKKGYGFTVRFSVGGNDRIIVTHVPANAQMAAVYRGILAGHWQCEQVGTYVVVHV